MCKYWVYLLGYKGRNSIIYTLPIDLLTSKLYLVHSYHQFTPLNRREIVAKRISNQTHWTTTYDFIKNRITNATQTLKISYQSIGDYVACIYYDCNWYVGLVQKVCKEEGDVRVSFMHPKGPGRSENSFFWPTREDRCYFPETEILCKISAPIPSSKSARKYILSDLDSQFIADKNKLRKS